MTLETGAFLRPTRMTTAWAAARTRLAGAGLLAALCCVLGGQAQVASAEGIYSCVDATGKRHTSDRPIPECLDREQRMLNRDGSQKRTVPPRMNAEERAAQEEREHQRALAEAAQKDAIRRDRNLMLRYPNEAVHNKAREAALDDLRRNIEASEKHLRELQSDRKPLIEETEFYKGKRLPGKLRTKLEANDAQQQAQKDIIAQQRAEITRVNALYDAELTRLRRLWAGAPPGSVPMEPPAASGGAGSSTPR